MTRLALIRHPRAPPRTRDRTVAPPGRSTRISVLGVRPKSGPIPVFRRLPKPVRSFGRGPRLR